MSQEEVNETQTGQGAESNEETKEERTFTREQLANAVKSQLATEKAEWEAAKVKELEEAKTEAEKLAKLSADERAEAERAKREQEIEEREKALNQREYKLEAVKQLDEAGLSTDFVDMVMSDNAEATKENIGALKSAFDKAVEATVNERIKATGDSPKTGAGASAEQAFANALGLKKGS